MFFILPYGTALTGSFRVENIEKGVFINSENVCYYDLEDKVT